MSERRCIHDVSEFDPCPQCVDMDKAQLSEQAAELAALRSRAADAATIGLAVIKERDEAHAEVTALKAKHQAALDNGTEIANKFIRAEAKLLSASEALEFYADAENYDEYAVGDGETAGFTDFVRLDHGDKARSALLALKGKPNG